MVYHFLSQIEIKYIEALVPSCHLHQHSTFLRTLFSHLTGFSLIKRDDKRSKTKPLQCLISLFETAENKKENSLLKKIQGFDLFLLCLDNAETIQTQIYY